MSTVRADITTSRSGPERWSQSERERVSVSVCAGLILIQLQTDGQTSPV